MYVVCTSNCELAVQITAYVLDLHGSQWYLSCAKKSKAEHLYSALHGIQTTLKRSGMDHTVFPATNTMLALPRKGSLDGATTD